MSNTTEPEGLYITSSKHVFCDGAGKIYLEAQLVLWELAGVVEKQGKDAKKNPGNKKSAYTVCERRTSVNGSGETKE